MTGPDIWDRITVLLCVRNSAYILPGTLASVAAAKHIVVVDAMSTDDTVAVARAAHSGVEVIELVEDRGLAAAINTGFAAADTEFVLNLNPDTILDPDCVARLVADADENPGAAGIAPLLTNGRGDPELDVMHGHEINHRKLGLSPAGPFCTWFVTGAVVLWRKNAFDAIGGMDERFFLYNEDADICLRATRAGYSLVLDPRARAVHLGGASERVSLATRRRKDWNMMWGHLIYERKHRSPEAADDLARSYVRDCRRAAIKGMLALRPKKAVTNLAKAEAARQFLRRDPPWGRPNLTWPED